MTHPYICYFKTIENKETKEYNFNRDKCSKCTGFLGYGTCDNYIMVKSLETKQGLEKLMQLTK